MLVTDRARAERVRATIDCWAQAMGSKYRPPPADPKPTTQPKTQPTEQTPRTE